MFSKKNQQKENTDNFTIRTMGNPVYGIYKLGGGYYRLCKALKDYNNEKEAIDDLIKLLNREITEEDLLEQDCFVHHPKEKSRA
jgi:hypothetical protein